MTLSQMHRLTDARRERRRLCGRLTTNVRFHEPDDAERAAWLRACHEVRRLRELFAEQSN